MTTNNEDDCKHEDSGYPNGETHGQQNGKSCLYEANAGLFIEDEC